VILSAKQRLKAAIRALGLEISRYHAPFNRRCVTRRPTGKIKGRVLLSYILDPFMLSSGQSVSVAHTHHTESLLIAQCFLELGYVVDAIDYRNDEFTPSRRYDFFVGARTNFDRLARLLDPNCIKIAHMDTAHFAFNNAQAYRRIVDVAARRTIAVPSIRVVEHNHAIENADYAAILGNTSTLDTYRFATKRMFALPIPAAREFAFDESKNYDACRRHFLWFGSGGFVHKGLDLVLEAFAELPDCHLTVCGPIDAEPDFTRVFDRELYRTPNIRTVGWVDIAGPELTRIAAECVGVVYPSCAEGQAGSVVTCLHAGLVPIMTRETGIDALDFGVLLEEPSIDEVRQRVRWLASRSVEELRLRSRRAWDFARRHCTADQYARQYRNMLTQILDEQRGPKASLRHG
jgi:glycosyltransferase involved in cell wall biosynthesis